MIEPRRAPSIAAALLVAACTSSSPVPKQDARATQATVSAASSAATPIAIGPDADKADVSSIAGKPAPEWQVSSWINSRPLATADLRGRVVLVRWFMSSDCPYCSATAPSLVELDKDYTDKGLTVLGMYHHKSEGPLVVEDVRKLAQDHYGFRFPVAIDDDWKTLKRWWLDAHPDSWTSVSFLLDRRGTVRFVHLGGEYAPKSDDYRQVRGWIEALLAERADG